MTLILLKISDKQLEEIDRASSLQVKNRSQFIRDCISYYLMYFKKHEMKVLINLEKGRETYFKENGMKF